MLKNSVIYFFLGISLCVPLYAQMDQSVDQNLKLARGADSARILIDYAEKLTTLSPEKSIEYAERAVTIAENNNVPFLAAQAAVIVGDAHFLQSYYKNAVDAYKRASDYASQSDSNAFTVEIVLKLADTYAEMQDSRAFEEYNQVLEYYRSSEEYSKVAFTNASVAELHVSLGNYDNALNTFDKAISIVKENELADAVAALQVRKARGMLVAGYNDDAKSAVKAAEKYYKSKNNKRALIEIYSIKGDLAYNFGDYNGAVSELTHSLDLAREFNDKSTISDINKKLSLISYQQEDFAKAYDYLYEYVEISDSLYASNVKRQEADKILKRQSEIQTQLESSVEEKEQSIQELEIKNLQNEVEAERAKNTRNIAILSTLVILIAGALLWYGYQIKRRANHALEEKNKKINEQNSKLEVLNKELQESNERVMASIRYAEKIQNAILPDEATMKTYFDDFYILFKPKDIVSGDFYWASRVSGINIFAVIDCTGHGVPGAFMSMIGNTLLNEIVNVKKILEPNLILEELDRSVRKSLNQDKGSNTNDGMDVCLVCYDEAAKTVKFCGAGRPLYFACDGEFSMFKGDMRGIGGRVKEKYDPFNVEIIKFQNNCLIYLLTDGYVDQNDSERKKFGSAGFKEMINNIANEPTKKQFETIVGRLSEHKGEEEQRDDITLALIKLGKS